MVVSSEIGAQGRSGGFYFRHLPQIILHTTYAQSRTTCLLTGLGLRAPQSKHVGAHQGRKDQGGKADKQAPAWFLPHTEWTCWKCGCLVSGGRVWEESRELKQRP